MPVRVSPTTLCILFPFSLSLLASLSDITPYLPLSFPPRTLPESFSSSAPLRVLYYTLHPLIAQLAPTVPFNITFILTALIAHRLSALQRLWGTRKWVSYLISIWFLAGISLACLQLVSLFALRFFDRHTNPEEPLLTIPSGPLTLLISLLPAWSTTIPPLWTWNLVIHLPALFPARALEPSNDSSQQTRRKTVTVRVSSHTTSYLLAVHLSLTQFPNSILPVVLGYNLGSLWARGWFPSWLGRWRIPAWIVGQQKSQGERSEKLRKPGPSSPMTEQNGDLKAGAGIDKGLLRSREQEVGQGMRRRGPS